MELIAEDKSGRVKFTFEMELNNQVMMLIKDDIDMLTDLPVQGANAFSSQMQSRRKHGQVQAPPGHGMSMHGEG